MAVNEDQEARAGGGPPGGKTDIEAQTRGLVAILVSATFSAIALIVVIGGLMGRFDQTLVDTVIAALASAAGVVWLYFFHRSKSGDE